jgi:hypothetical protein
MRIRSRILVALVALISFSASVAEGLWASSCAGTEEPTSATAIDMSMPMGGGHPSNAPVDHEQRSDPGSCPLPALLGTGCLVASLPATTVQVDLAASEVREAPVVRSTLFDRLEVTGLFRPPQQ